MLSFHCNIKIVQYLQHVCKNGGVLCPGQLKELKVCMKECGNECSNDFFGEWSNWSECVKGEKCEDNYQSRIRELQKECGGDSYLTEKRKCFLENCF